MPIREYDAFYSYFDENHILRCTRCEKCACACNKRKGDIFTIEISLLKNHVGPPCWAVLMHKILGKNNEETMRENPAHIQTNAHTHVYNNLIHAFNSNELGEKASALVWTYRPNWWKRKRKSKGERPDRNKRTHRTDIHAEANIATSIGNGFYYLMNWCFH